MGQVLVRNVEDDVIAGLKTRARIAGVSLEAFLRNQLTALAPLDGDEKIALLSEFQRRHGVLDAVTSPEDIIHEEREKRSRRVLEDPS